MQKITELRDSLLDNYEKMKSGEMEIKKGKELANVAGKVLLSVRVELEYNEFFGIKERIDFVEKDTSVT